MKLSPVCMALMLASGTVAAETTVASNIERISVVGSTFNDYKHASASGAMRGDISVMDTAQSVAIIPEIILDEQLATSLGDVLINDSSVTAGSKKWNREVFSMRGFELESSTGYLRDGNQVFAHYQLPIETLDRVEVIKGPSSFLYGYSAPGGLINMVPKKPTVDGQVGLDFDTDDNGSTRYQVDVSGALNDSGSVRGRAIVVKQNEIMSRQYQNGEDRERDRLLGSFQLETDIGDWGTLALHYDRTEDTAGIDVGGWLDADGNLIGDKKMIWDQHWAFIDNTAENVGLYFNTHLTDNIQLKLGYNDQTFKRQRFDSSPKYADYNAEAGTYTFTPFDRHDTWEVKSYFADFSAQFDTAGIEHQLLFGANGLDQSYRQQRVSGSNTSVTIGTPADVADLNYRTGTPSNSGYDFYGVYLQDLISVNEHWKLLLGVRYDSYKNDNTPAMNSDTWSPRFGVIYQPWDNTSFYASYSESFEPKGSVGDNDEDANSGMDLSPEMGESFEIGAKAELFNGHLLLTGAYFDIKKIDIVVTQKASDGYEVPEGYTQITTQDGEQHHKGVELGAQGQLSDNLFVATSAMYLDAEYIRHNTLEGKRPIEAPEWSANAWTRYDFDNGLALNLGAVYEGERFANTANTITKDAYLRWDLGASYAMNFAGQDVNLRMNVENLFDTDYFGGGSNSEVTIGEGRNFRFSVSTKF